MYSDSFSVSTVPEAMYLMLTEKETYYNLEKLIETHYKLLLTNIVYNRTPQVKCCSCKELAVRVQD